MSENILDGEILSVDETDEAAEIRRQQQELAQLHERRALIVVEAGGERALVEVLPEQYEHAAQALDAKYLFLGLYNKSGRAPTVADFEPVDWTDDERRSMGKPPRTRTPMLEADNTKPFRAAERVGIAALYHVRGGNYAAMVKAVTTAYVTHFTIGSPTHGILLAGHFTNPLKVLSGGWIKLGVNMSAAHPLFEPESMKKRLDQ